MATVMTWENGEGIQGRCDSSCHNARLPECVCMCGGRFHGCGLMAGGMEAAVREYGEQVLASAKRKAAREGFEIHAKNIGELLKVFSKISDIDLL